MEKENLKQYDYSSVTYNAEEMDVTDPEQKELAQSLIREWECPATLKPFHPPN